MDDPFAEPDTPAMRAESRRRAVDERRAASRALPRPDNVTVDPPPDGSDKPVRDLSVRYTVTSATPRFTAEITLRA